MKDKLYFVYILASDRNGTLYVGVTNSLVRRVGEHKGSQIKGFTKRYEVRNLVYYEMYDDVNQALTREKQLKKWNREWKIKLIEKKNNGWIDLYPQVLKYS